MAWVMGMVINGYEMNDSVSEQIGVPLLIPTIIRPYLIIAKKLCVCPFFEEFWAEIW